MKKEKCKINKYVEYFAPEFKQILQNTTNDESESSKINLEYGKHISSILSLHPDIDLFQKNREIGENHNFLCEIIRNDLIEEFKTKVKKSEIQINQTIPQSPFETNSFLLKNKNTSLIEYAAFFGSIHIFKYLCQKKVRLMPSLWLYAIHGNELEIIRILEEQKIQPKDKSFKECMKESIKCHHNNIVNYIQLNLLNEKTDLNESILYDNFHYYNFLLFTEEINNSMFFYSCEFDYYELVKLFLETKKIDINATFVLIFII